MESAVPLALVSIRLRHGSPHLPALRRSHARRHNMLGNIVVQTIELTTLREFYIVSVSALGTGHVGGGGGGLQNGRGGGACEVLPQRKGGGGEIKF